MKIQVASDLHIGLGNPNICTDNDADILVVAGDVGEYGSVRSNAGYLKKFCKHYEYVLYIPGNHEYYWGSIPEVDTYWKHEVDMPDNFVYLNQDAWIYPDNNDYIFLCCTLWSKLLHDPQAAMQVASALNDFRLIDKMNIQYYDNLHENHLHWLRENLEWNDNKLIPIVITHHAPSYKSIADKYKTGVCSAFNNGFSSNLDFIIEEHPEIKLWIHGHTHTGFDYKIGDTRVLCNPNGYGNENPSFNKELIVELL